MYTENNFTTPRARISDSLRQRVLDGSSTSSRYAAPQMPSEAPSKGSMPNPDMPSLASVYAPVQYWRELYDMEYGFHQGTIFKELNFPFVCGEHKGGGGYGCK